MSKTAKPQLAPIIISLSSGVRTGADGGGVRGTRGPIVVVLEEVVDDPLVPVPVVPE